MGKWQKVRDKILTGTSDSNVEFADMVGLLRCLEGITTKPQSGSHIMFAIADAPEIVNLQDNYGKCKTYQVRQVRDLIVRYNLTISQGE